MKIGVLGGTFDPVHLGHLAMAEEAWQALGLAEVVLIPSGQPVYKSDRKIAPAADRLEMLRLAAAGRPYLEVSTIETDRPGASYTVDTLTALKMSYGSRAELYFILGWDSLAQLGGWRQPRRLVSLCLLVAVPRPGFPRPDIKTMEKQVPGISEKLIFLDKPEMAVSATEIRKKASLGRSLEGLVPAPVADYIKKHGLYKSLDI